MKDARFTLPTPALLAKVVDLLDGVPAANADFLFEVLSRYYRYFQAKGVGSTFINISRDELEALPIPLVKSDKAAILAGRIGAVEKLKAVHRDSLSELDSLFASMQQRAFQGEL